MTQDEIKALIEDLRLNHEFCPKEVILQAADELEKQRTWVGLTKEEFEQAVHGLEDLEDCWVQIEDKLKEKNHE